MEILKMNIKLDTVKDVNDFIEITNRFDGDITVAGKVNIANGKSIFGLFSLDLTKVLTLSAKLHTKENVEELRDLLSPFCRDYNINHKQVNKECLKKNDWINCSTY